MSVTNHLEQVRIIIADDIHVAAFEHRGDPLLVGNSVQKFIAWRKQNHLHPDTYATFNILYNNPAEVAADEFRVDICVAIDKDVTDNDCGIVSKSIPGGRCAVLRHIGPEESLIEAVSYLYSQWFPQSGEKLRDFPIYMQRVLFFPGVPENEAVTDIYLPLV